MAAEAATACEIDETSSVPTKIESSSTLSLLTPSQAFLLRISIAPRVLLLLKSSLEPEIVRDFITYAVNRFVTVKNLLRLWPLYSVTAIHLYPKFGAMMRKPYPASCESLKG